MKLILEYSDFHGPEHLLAKFHSVKQNLQISLQLDAVYKMLPKSVQPASCILCLPDLYSYVNSSATWLCFAYPNQKSS